MAIIQGNSTLSGAANISASGTTYGITQNSAGQVRMPYIPAFKARGVASGTYVSGNVIIYGTVDYNNGGHYNSSTGQFTAPISGYYHFWHSDIGSSGDSVYRKYPRLNGSNVYSGRHLRGDNISSGSEYVTNGYHSLIIEMSAGDTMEIYFGAGSNLYPNGNSTSQYLSFTGWLLP